MILSRDDILSADDLKRKIVDIPEWEGAIYVKEMSAFEGVQYDTWVYENKDNKAELASKFDAMIVMLTACDKEGNRLFSPDDVESLMKKKLSALEKISLAARRLNGMTEDEQEDISGNLPAGLTGDSNSA